MFKRGEEPLNVFVTLNPGSLWAPLFPPNPPLLVFASEKLSLFSPPLKQLHETQDQVFNGY